MLFRIPLSVPVLLLSDGLWIPTRFSILARFAGSTRFVVGFIAMVRIAACRFEELVIVTRYHAVVELADLPRRRGRFSCGVRI